MNAIISVIIPVYNVEEYIADCLKSVLAQSYPHIEVLCVDDRGSDASMKIVEEFATQDSRVKIVRHGENKGLGPARNTGMDAAIGDFILFLDSDDMLYPESLKKLLETALSSGADVTAGRVIAFPHIQDEKLIAFAARYNEYDKNAPAGLFQFSEYEDRDSPCHRLSVVAHGRLFSASFLKDEKLRFIDQKVVHEDDGFFHKYMACRPLVAITDIPTIQYRIRPGSIMTSLDAKAHEERKRKHLALVLADARSYIESRYDKKAAQFILYSFGSFEEAPFIFKCGHLFRLQWGVTKKTVWLLGLPLYKERLDSRCHKVCKVFGITVWKSRGPLR